MRFSGLVVPVILIVYGLLIQNGTISSISYVSDTVFVTIMSVWMVVAIYQYLFYGKTVLDAAIRAISFHTLAVAYILFVSGISMPFIGCWVLLTLANYAFFSIKGLWLSLVTLIGVAAASTVLHRQEPDLILTNIMTVAAVLIVALATVALVRVQETDSKKLERSQNDEKLQRDSILTLVNNLADAILSTDQHGVIRVYNAAILGLLDTNADLIGKHIDDILTLTSEDDKPVKLFDSLKKSKGVVVIDTLRTVIAEERLRLEITYSPIRSSYSRAKQAQDGYIIILRDVTKAKSLEEERDEFISVVSHELRTPIAIAEGTISNAQLMFERDDIHDDLLREGLETAHDQVIFLAKMVNDLSTLSRAERGVADSAEDIDAKELIDGLYTEYAPEAEKKGLHLNLDTKGKLGVVVTSRLYVHELLQNFITNAIKYTKEGSVTLSVNKKDDKILFVVKDTGIGISKTDQAKIFHKFYRSEDYRTRETSGTGLGLYVAMKLSKKIGTHILLESRLNHGSSFSFSLPVKKDRSSKT
ncbi:MAG: ATP-binding protein [Candidatus Saccharibacteria bacterium]